MARARSDSPPLFEIVERPDFSFETKAMASGLWPVAGMDEAGRGPLAGPVVAAAVILDPANIPEGLDDSKRLSHLQREALFLKIVGSALGVSMASVCAEGIDASNILKASLEAMRRALVGLPIGVFLATSGRNELFPAPALNRAVGLVVNAARSTPFIILVVAIIPLTRLLTGTSIGTSAAIVPLTIATVPFFARLVEAAIRDVDKGLIEAARAMGATPMQIVFKVLLAEARPAILLAFTMTIVSLIGYSAMVGAVGGGGLGDLGIRYGYQRFMPEVMLAVVVVLIVLVQLVQSAGDALARRFDKRNRKS